MFFWLNFCSSSISSFKLCKLEMKLTSVYFISHQNIYTLYQGTISCMSAAQLVPAETSCRLLHFCWTVQTSFTSCGTICPWLIFHDCCERVPLFACSLAWAFLKIKIAAALRGLSSTFVCFEQRLMLNVGLGYFGWGFFFPPQFYFQSLLCCVETQQHQTVTEMYLVNSIKISCCDRVAGACSTRVRVREAVSIRPSYFMAKDRIPLNPLAL